MIKVIKIPNKLKRWWDIDPRFVLESRTKYHNEPAFRFSYHLESHELLISTEADSHALSIAKYGSHPFDEYVRGFYLRDRKILGLRWHWTPKDAFELPSKWDEHESKSHQQETVKVLKQNGLPDDVEILYNLTNEEVRKLTYFV